MKSTNSSYDNEKNGKKRISSFFIISMIIIIFSFSVFAYDIFFGKQIVKTTLSKYFDKLEQEAEKFNSKNDYDKEKKTANKNDYMTFVDNTKNIFKPIGKGFVHCTKDGIKYYSSIGKEKWNDTFTISSPIVVNDGNYVAVAEAMGRNIKMYNADGKIYELSMEAPIVKISINENGYMAVLMNNKDNYIIKIINSSGNVVVQRVEATKNTYPISLDVSSDNRTFAVGYIDTNDIKVVSKVLFFYINESDNVDNIDGIFSGIEKSNEYMAYISFMSDDRLVCVTDKSIFTVGSNGVEIWSFELLNIVEMVSLDNKNYIVYACGDDIDNKNGYDEGTIVIIDMKGKILSKFDAGKKVTYLNSYDDGIVIGSYKNFSMINKNGDIIWEHIAIQDIVDIIPLDKSYVLYITKNYIQYVNMKNYLPVKLQSDSK